MADPAPRPHDFARHARQHLESLKSAGIEWLPRAQSLVTPRRERSEGSATSASTLFGDSEPTATVAAMAVPPIDDRRRELAVLADQVRPCQRCSELVAARTQTVFGVGPVDAELCVIGEAPGG